MTWAGRSQNSGVLPCPGGTKKLWSMLVLSLLVLAPAGAYSEWAHAGVRLGVGITRDERTYSGYRTERERLRPAFNVKGRVPYYQDGAVSLALAGDVEVSLATWEYRSSVNGDWETGPTGRAFRLFADLLPEVGMDIGPTVAARMAAGPSFGAQTETWEYDGWEERSYGEINAGACLRPRLLMRSGGFVLATEAKYRYLLTTVSDLDETDDWDDSEDWKGDAQSCSIAFSLGTESPGFYVEFGLQVGNWVYKHEDSDKWPKWPEAWEYTPFAEVGFPL